MILFVAIQFDLKSPPYLVKQQYAQLNPLRLKYRDHVYCR